MFALCVFSLVSNVRCVCLLSVALDVCVDVGLECEWCTLGLTLSVELVMLALSVKYVPCYLGDYWFVEFGF